MDEQDNQILVTRPKPRGFLVVGELAVEAGSWEGRYFRDVIRLRKFRVVENLLQSGLNLARAVKFQ